MSSRTAETNKRTKSGRRATIKAFAIPGMPSVRLVQKPTTAALELRDQLGVTREFFARLVDVSVRTIAEVEANPKPIKKLMRNYTEVQRLCEALGEVVDSSEIATWLNTPNDAFDSLKPIEVIERGQIDRLWNMVFRLRSGMPG